MSKSLVYALHGFLGQGADWDFLRKPLQKSQTELIMPDLFSETSLAITDFHTYAKSLADGLRQKTNQKKIFIGYSLGGRLGLHLLELDPHLFDHYVFLSTNPGLQATNDSSERQQRLQSDLAWSQKITTAHWDAFCLDWNAQKVFEGSNQEPERYQKDFDLQKLQMALTHWSLARQKDFSQVIETYQNKITWVVGDQDTKYSLIADDLKQKKILLDLKRIFSSHRILCDQPQFVLQLIQELI